MLYYFDYLLFVICNNWPTTPLWSRRFCYFCWLRGLGGATKMYLVLGLRFWVFRFYRTQVRSLELSFQSVTVVVAKQSSSLQKICQSYNILFSKFFHVFFAPCQTKPSWKLNWIWRFWSFCYWIEVIPAVGSTIFSFQTLARLCDEETEV